MTTNYTSYSKKQPTKLTTNHIPGQICPIEKNQIKFDGNDTKYIVH